MTEQLIAAIKTNAVVRLPRGFTALPEDDMFSYLANHGMWLGPRSVLETDDTFLQIIPYIVVFADRGVLAYNRGKRGSETRLANQTTFGFGGHIDLNDAAEIRGEYDASVPAKRVTTWEALIKYAAFRELDEELGICAYNFSFHGLIYTPHDNAAGPYHLGVAMSLKLRSTDFCKPGEEVGQLRVLPVPIPDSKKGYESWSEAIRPYVLAWLAV